MPTYEYACKACGHEFEREQRITEPPLKTCPKCRKRQAQRLISATAFVLKGGGWYSDLYSSPKATKGNGGEGSDKSTEGGKPSGGDAKKAPAEGKGGKSGGGGSGAKGAKGASAGSA